MATRRILLPRLYAITDMALSGAANHADIVGQLLEGGCRWIQLREKSLPDNQFYEQLKESLALCLPYGATLLVNDRVDLAWAAGAHGVHLGQGDLPPALPRKLLGPDRVIGRSTHSLEQASEDDSDEAVDYVAIGPIFSTATKVSGNTPLGLEGLREVRRRVRKPLIAIGGIDSENARQVLQAGADSVALISALMTASSVSQETEKMVSLLSSV